MNRFQDFDYVELVGETRDSSFPVGSRGYIVEIFSNDEYYVEFDEENDEEEFLATVHASHLRLIRHFAPSPQPVQESSTSRDIGAFSPR